MVTVRWNRESFSFELPPPDTPLSAIRKSISDYTGLPYDGFKLIHSGAVMKDNNATVSAYHLSSRSTIQLIDTSHPLPPPPVEVSAHSQANSASALGTKTEQSTIELVRAELQKVRQTLTPDVETFLLTTQRLGGTKPPDDLDREHKRLGELLLQSLLRLDSITADPEWETARSERKIAVKAIQGLLDRVDSSWEAVQTR